MSGLKSFLQGQLKRVGLYDRLKGSRAYDFYWQFANRRVLENRRQELSFYRNLLSDFSEGDLIFDVGANQGTKSDLFLRLGARVIAVEPDQENQSVLQRRFRSLRLHPKPLIIVGKALADRDAVQTMWIDEPGSAKNTLSEKWVDTLRSDGQRFGQSLAFRERREIETTTIDHLIEQFGHPRFIKIDVEGFELAVLKGMQRPVRCLSFEVNLPEFRTEGLGCIERLRVVDAEGEFNYARDCREGLLLSNWTDADKISTILNECTEPSVEIFWKSSRAKRN
jgi:FkbM family methyltransferase